jgi:hypothetical protein
VEEELMSRGWVVITIAVGGLLFFLLSFHLVLSSNGLTIIPKEHLSFADTFVSVDTLIRQYNERSVGEKLLGEGVNRYLIRKLQDKELISSTSTSADHLTHITLAKFNQIRPGMTLAEVEAILGTARGEQGVTHTGGLYTWKNKDGSSVNVGIMDGRVTATAQWGLK